MAGEAAMGFGSAPAGLMEIHRLEPGMLMAAIRPVVAEILMGGLLLVYRFTIAFVRAALILRAHNARFEREIVIVHWKWALF